jgi:hypothetical protein
MHTNLDYYYSMVPGSFHNFLLCNQDLVAYSAVSTPFSAEIQISLSRTPTPQEKLDVSVVLVKRDNL